MREYGQITIKQLELMTELNEAEATMIMHQAFHKGLVYEPKKNCYMLNTINSKSYSNELEQAMTLALTLCKNNEQFTWDNCFNTDSDTSLIFMGTSDADYDIVYVPVEKERITVSKLKRNNLGSNLLLIIEHIGQMEELSKLENISAVYIVKDGGLEFVQ